MKLLFDWNNLSIRCLFGCPEINAHSSNPDYKLWEYITFNSIYYMLYKEKVDEVILGVDSGSWRKLIFPEYKAQRKDVRDKSDVNWEEFYKHSNNFLEEIKENLPFKVISFPKAEADDVLAILAKNINNSVIVSADADFLQLSNVCKIYHPLRKKYVSENDCETFVTKLCLMGQKKDNIFNIKTPIDWPKEKRRPPFGEKTAEKCLQNIENVLKNYKYDFEYVDENGDPRKYINEVNGKERFELNKKLLDFNCIPPSIINKVLEKYNTYKTRSNPDNLYKYIKEKNWREILENFDDVESKLLNLY